MTFEEALQEFSSYLRIECGLAANSLAAYGGDLADLTRFLAGREVTTLEQVTLAHAQAWLRNLADRSFATSSISRKLAAMRMFWRYLYNNGRVASDLVNLLESPKLWQRLPRIVDTNQVDGLLAEPQDSDRLYLRDRAILELFYACGLRVSELADLKLGDINLDVGFVRCIGKGRKERIVPVGGPASAALKEYLASQRTDLVRARTAVPKRRAARPRFVDDAQDSKASPAAKAATENLNRIFLSRTGKPLDRHNIYRLVRRYAIRAGITVKMTPHSLRHCFASHLLSGGADLRIVQELLGHASVVTTQIYTHVDRARLKRIHEKFHPMG